MMLRGKTAIITGAAGGIGHATSAVLAREGANLCLVDTDADALEELSLGLEAQGVERTRIVCVTADVTNPLDVKEYIDHSIARFGCLDVLFNNAGIEGQVALMTDYDERVFDRVFDVNVKGVFLNLKYGISALLNQGRGGIVINTSSGLGLVGMASLSAYVASKHAVMGLTRTAAIEFGSEGIRTVAICPGPVDTRMMESLEGQAADRSAGGSRAASHDEFVQNSPMKRYARPSEIAELVAFLASDRAEYINGAAISIDGGSTAF
jgi:meso-butanediol dehydrogenase/(S,S)-butanediol dehydrogenase/diacetyl reductase